MTLIEDWKAVLTKAWSVKFNIIAAVFGGIELAIGAIKPDGVQPGLFGVVAVFVSLIAIGARVMAQKELTNAPDK